MPHEPVAQREAAPVHDALHRRADLATPVRTTFSAAASACSAVRTSLAACGRASPTATVRQASA
jgi:hypothetical protein